MGRKWVDIATEILGEVTDPIYAKKYIGQNPPPGGDEEIPDDRILLNKILIFESIMEDKSNHPVVIENAKEACIRAYMQLHTQPGEPT